MVLDPLAPPDAGNAPPDALVGEPADDGELLSYLAALTVDEYATAADLDRAEGRQ